jgi:hypothetical protein
MKYLRIADATVEIRTGHLANTSAEEYRYATPLGMHLVITCISSSVNIVTRPQARRSTNNRGLVHGTGRQIFCQVGTRRSFPEDKDIWNYTASYKLHGLETAENILI